MVIGLLACANKKNNTACKAKDMYLSPLFTKSYEYLTYRCDKIYILSAKYGLLHTDTIIQPYNITLLKMDRRQRKIWAYNILKDLEKETDLQNDEYVIMGGVKYTEYIC